MTDAVMDWWNANSARYQEDSRIPIEEAHYGPYAPFESQLNLLGNVSGKNILEIGCGGGQCSVAFARQGAHCVGLDISAGQLAYARRLAVENDTRVEFVEGSFDDLGAFGAGSQDIVFSAFALQYAADLDRAFGEIHRVLRAQGLFVFSVDHPFYVVFDAKSPRIAPDHFRIERSYFETGRCVKTWPDDSSRTFIFFKRKVSDIYNLLVSAGFIVERIVEPFDSTQELWQGIFPIDLAALVGPTIIFKTRKV